MSHPTVDPKEQKALDDIRRVGCHIICVREEDDLPPFAYSVGIQQTSGAPEVIVIGLKQELSVSVVNCYNRRVRAGETFAAGHHYDGFLEGFKVLFKTVDNSYYGEYVGWNRWLYDGDSFEVLQIVYPTTDGVWPWSAGVSDWFRNRQPLLYAD